VSKVEATKVEALIGGRPIPYSPGTSDMSILQVPSLEAAHGYAIAPRVQPISRDIVRINQGFLHPALHRLELKRWLQSEWRHSETGRVARFHALTRAGHRQLGREKASWDQLTAAVRLIFHEGALA
jgi:transcriptional regulator